MLVSHETTLDTLELVQKYNDYDYALIHLFKHPGYRKFFIESLKNREVYLDNSVFELGEAFKIDDFLKEAKEFYNINKDNFTAIMPDVLDNCTATIKNLHEFVEKAPDDMKMMGVLQGETTEELITCYYEMRKFCEIIGINHISKAFGTKTEPIEVRSQNRINFVKNLDKIAFADSQKLHLLGILLPAEIIKLNECKSIYSADTSNPVCLALEGKSYGERIDSKPLWSVDSWIKTYKDTEVPNYLLHIIIKNIIDFKNFLR